MKKSILNPVFSLCFSLIAVFAFSQNNDVAYTEVAVPAKSVLSKDIPVFSTNLNDVLKEVENYLDNNVKAPEILGFYNSDQVVLASFDITENGEIENISISRKSDKLLGEVVKKELDKLTKITPIKEDGKAVRKYVSVPVVFKVN